MSRTVSHRKSLLHLIRLQLRWRVRSSLGVVFNIGMAGIMLYLGARLGGRGEYLDVLVPGVIALVTASRALHGTAVTLSYMRRYGEWRTIRASPVPTWMFLTSFVLSSLVMTLCSVAAVLCVAKLLLDYTYQGNLALLAVYVTSGFVTFASLGLVVTYLVSQPQTVTSVVNVLFVAMMISGNTLVAADAVWLRLAALTSPMTAFSWLLRNHAQGAGAWSEWWLSVATLTAWVSVASTAALHLARTRAEEA